MRKPIIMIIIIIRVAESRATSISSYLRSRSFIRLLFDDSSRTRRETQLGALVIARPVAISGTNLVASLLDVSPFTNNYRSTEKCRIRHR